MTSLSQNFRLFYPMQDQSAWQWLLVLVATFPLAGCQYLSAGEDIEIIDPIGTTIETQQAEADQEVANTLDDEDAFEDSTSEAPPVVTADLIQSTDPSARAQAVSRSRVDPFATLPIPLATEPIGLPEETSASANNTSKNTTTSPSDFSIPSNSTRSSNPTQASNSTRSSNPTQASNSTQASNPTRSSNSTQASEPARPPNPTRSAAQVREESIVEPSSVSQPVVAQTVAVSGVIRLGDTSYAIVQAANEPERYVKVGDRIGNGSVQVIHIDMLAYEPKVTFEENGIKVTRPVSSDAPKTETAPTEETTEPAAALPLTVLFYS